MCHDHLEQKQTNKKTLNTFNVEIIHHFVARNIITYVRDVQN